MSRRSTLSRPPRTVIRWTSVFVAPGPARRGRLGPWTRCSTPTTASRSTRSWWARWTTTSTCCAAPRPATPCCSTPPTSTTACSTCAGRLGVRSVLETHGHWDHIQAVPQLRDAGYEVHVTAQDADDAALLRPDPRRRRGRRGRAAAAAHDPHARATRRGRCASSSRGRPCCSAATRCSPAGRATRRSRAATSPPSSTRSRTGCSPCPPETRVLPGHGDPTTIGTERPSLQEWIDRGW